MSGVRVVIVGARGQVGRALARRFPDAELLDLDELDASDAAAVGSHDWSDVGLLVNAAAADLSDHGRIVLVGSRTSTGAAGKSQYAASKAALRGLARSWAMELAPRGITVNVVAPGPTATAMLVDPARAATPPRVPALGRFVEPSEVAALIAYLVGDDGGLEDDVLAEGPRLGVAAGQGLVGGGEGGGLSESEHAPILPGRTSRCGGPALVSIRDPRTC